MTLTLKLTEEQADRIEAFRAQGIDIDASLRAVVLAVLEKLPSNGIDAENTAAMSLLDKLNKAGATDDPQQLRNS